MTSSSFSGAMDLSALKAKADAANRAPGAGASASGANYVVAITQANLQQILGESTRYPVLVEFWSPRAQGADQLSSTLAELANSSGGRFVLGRIDVDAEPEIAQALGVAAVPTVVAFLAGQVAPLFQGTQPPEQIRAVVDQVLQAAVANGVVGTAPPQGGSPAGEAAGDPEAPDPRFDAADAAVAAGDYAKAEEEFDKLIAAAPNDAAAKAGKAQVGLLARTSGVNNDAAVAIARADVEPDSVDAQLAAADFELVAGNAAAGFERLIGLVRRTAGEDRERVRARVLELFDTVDPSDPAVLKARRDLMTALF